MKARNEKMGRSHRREAEDLPAVDYVEKMLTLGPREKEGRLAYHKRLGAIMAARELILKVWKIHGNEKVHCAEILGVPRNNLALELRNVGLTPEICRALIHEDTKESKDTEKKAGEGESKIHLHSDRDL